MTDQYLFVVIMLSVTVFLSIVSVLYALILLKRLNRIKVEHEKINAIASYIKEGAVAFMKRQYKVMFIVVLIVSVILTLIGFIPSLKGAEGIGYRSSITFLVGASFSGLAGFIGMLAAVKANYKTTDQARLHGMSKAIKTSFTGGSILGLTVVGLSLFGLTFLFLVFYTLYGGYKSNVHEQYIALSHAIHIVTGYGLGASLIALFGRVGGGIFTKAADVGADLVGKVESNIPEDDPRNPAVIADNVGDNVGDIAGMGSDLTESYIGTLISALTLGLYAFVSISPEIILNDSSAITSTMFSGIVKTVLFPLMIATIGVVSTIISIMIMRNRTWKDPQKALNKATYLNTLFMIVTTFLISMLLFEGALALKLFLTIVVGLFVGIGIGFIAEYYTSDKYKYVLNIVEQSKTGGATNVISGFSVGMKSTFITVMLLVSGILLAYLFTQDIYGIALAAVGMLSTAGMTISVDAYGPIVDNAGGIAEMSHLDEQVRNITDHLDSVGNTTAAIAKGFCIGSAALTSIGLFFAYEKATNLTASGVDILKPGVVIGVFIGAMLPYLFSSLVINSVGKAAHLMIEEVRLQYKNDPGILKGTSLPDYKKCVDISTQAALKEMIFPALIAILSPIIAGLLLGAQGLGGLLIGGLVSSMMLAIFMANSGGAWDNAKKYIEQGYEGGKGTDLHKATVIGDTVGDPLKDTAGPSMDILIKLMSIVSLMIAPILIQIEPLLKFLFK
ncbi:sodium-translocating pyrophosphatase [Tenericutes bacterium MO-XQ]|nr:sodium-translocating pyrophosphatase [Tenericutes bacterium MO-XQ]